MIDTHCHLTHERFQEDREEVLQRAISAGVGRFVTVGYDLASSEACVRLAAKHACLGAAVGVHPHDATTYADAEPRLRVLAREEGVVAIGETGLDYHYDFSPRPVQRQAFLKHLELAEDVGLPVVIHCREACADVLAILREFEGRIAGVLHCWPGSPAETESALAVGLYIGVGGVATFKSRGELDTVIAMTPHDRLLLETDAPYLTPVPHRGKRNEPAYLGLVCDAVARVWNLAPEAVAARTSENALRLFTGLKRPGC